MKNLTQQQKDFLRQAQTIEHKAELIEKADTTGASIDKVKALYREAAEYRIKAFE